MRNEALAGIAAVIALPLILGGCAADPMHRDANRVSLECPAGRNMVCEVNRIGRIRHGTFASNKGKCACVPDDGRSLDSPVIPTVRQ